MLKTIAFYPGSCFPPPGVSISSSSVNILIQRDCSNSCRKNSQRISRACYTWCNLIQKILTRKALKCICLNHGPCTSGQTTAFWWQHGTNINGRLIAKPVLLVILLAKTCAINLGCVSCMEECEEGFIWCSETMTWMVWVKMNHH